MIDYRIVVSMVAEFGLGKPKFHLVLVYRGTITQGEDPVLPKTPPLLPKKKVTSYPILYAT